MWGLCCFDSRTRSFHANHRVESTRQTTSIWKQEFPTGVTEDFGFRNPSSVPQEPMRAGFLMLDSLTETGAGFPCITLPQLQSKLRFACLGVSETTWCPVYKELWDPCSEGIKTCLQCIAMREVVTASPSPRLHRDNDSHLTLHKCHSRGEFKREKPMREVYYANMQE